MNRPRSTLPSWFSNHRSGPLDHDSGRNWLICFIVMFAVSLLMVGVIILYFGAKDMPMEQDEVMGGKDKAGLDYNKSSLLDGHLSLLQKLGQDQPEKQEKDDGSSTDLPFDLADLDLKALSNMSEREAVLELLKRVLKLKERLQTTSTTTTTTAAPKQGDGGDYKKMLDFLFSALHRLQQSKPAETQDSHQSQVVADQAAHLSPKHQPTLNKLANDQAGILSMSKPYRFL